MLTSLLIFHDYLWPYELFNLLSRQAIDGIPRLLVGQHSLVNINYLSSLKAHTSEHVRVIVRKLAGSDY